MAELEAAGAGGERVRPPRARAGGEQGELAATLERLARARPAGAYLALAGTSLAGALMLDYLGRHAAARFVVEWVPTFVVLGVWSRLVRSELSSSA